MKMAKGHNGLSWCCRNVGANVCIVWTYSLSWAITHVWCNCVDGGGVGFGAIQNTVIANYITSRLQKKLLSVRKRNFLPNNSICCKQNDLTRLSIIINRFDKLG